MSEESKSRIIDQSKIQSILSSTVFSKILECDVIIKNERRIFVGLKYDEAMATAPVIILQGDENLNRYLSIIEDLIKLSFYDYRPLARALYENFNEGDVLSDLYYKCVADIYKQLPRFWEMFS